MRSTSRSVQWSCSMDTVSLAKRRYTTKAYDAARKIPQATVDALLEQLRHSQVPAEVLVGILRSSAARAAHRG